MPNKSNSTAQYRQYIETAQKGSNEARDFLIERYKYLVDKTSKYYFNNSRNNNFDRADLYNEGEIGLIHAIQTYNTNKRYSFCSYCKWYINNSIRNYVRKNTSLIRVETTAAREFRKNITKFYIYSKYFDKNAWIVQCYNIASLNDIHASFSKSDRPVYIEDTIPDSKYNDDFYSREKIKHIRNGIAKFMSLLSKRNRKIFYHYYLKRINNENINLEKIGTILNLKKQRIHQLAKKIKNMFCNFAIINDITTSSL